jgi:DNA repair photolyase
MTLKVASLAEIKKELNQLNEKELIDLVLELSKFSRDNKAYLFFKLSEKDNPRLYVEMVQEELELEFQKANVRNYHYAKKAAQSIRRKMNKSLKLSKDKTAQIEIIAYFCRQIKAHGFLKHRHPVIQNLYEIQIRKIEKLIGGLHEDLQYDYQQLFEELNEG